MDLNSQNRNDFNSLTIEDRINQLLECDDDEILMMGVSELVSDSGDAWSSEWPEIKKTICGVTLLYVTIAQAGFLKFIIENDEKILLDTKSGLIQINAGVIVQLIDAILTTYPGLSADNENTRKGILGAISNHEARSFWSSIDASYWQSGENIPRLLRSYIMAHKEGIVGIVKTMHDRPAEEC